MVRSYILTDRERQILEFYIENEMKLNGYRELKYLINQIQLPRLESDLDLIKRFLDKAS